MFVFINSLLISPLRAVARWGISSPSCDPILCCHRRGWRCGTSWGQGICCTADVGADGCSRPRRQYCLCRRWIPTAPSTHQGQQLPLYIICRSWFYMHMYWLMFIGVEVEYKSEIFVYFRHIVVIVSRCKDTHLFLNSENYFIIFKKSCIFATFLD